MYWDYVRVNWDDINMDELGELLLNTDVLNYYNQGSDPVPFPGEYSKNCPICFIRPPEHVLHLCQHAFCDSCLVSYLEIKVTEFQVNGLLCPICSSDISETFIESVLSEKSFRKYKDFQKIKNLELDLYVKFCPVADCKGFDMADETNTKLTCNQCGHKYCYYCSQDWHKGKCEDNTEFSFKLWAYANNLKICPRCKNHVQKNGGCPHMTCPRCQFQWCWKCGKSTLSGTHNEINCKIGNSWFDIYWTNIVFLLFFPAFLPFLIFLVFFLFYYPQDNFSILSRIYNSLWSRLIFYLVLICLSPVIESLCAIGGLIFITLSITYFISKNSKFLCICGMALGLIVAGLSVCVGVLIIMLAPVAGVFFLTLKFYHICKRCSSKREVNFSYRRSIV